MLPTILVIHPKEKRAKCSLEPLRDRAASFDLLFVDFKPARSYELAGYVRLCVDGPPLSVGDAEHGLIVIDGSWRHAAAMQSQFAAAPPRSLSGYRTAYPRVSKLFQDPAAGLASIEALYIAYRILGRPTEGLLDNYRWAADFLRLNGWA
jgi:pre-rRNA-processing protein TSR3